MEVSKGFVDQYVQSLKMQEAQAEHRARMQRDHAVFISYSHRDVDTARNLCRVLDERGIQYVIDEKRLDWTDEIAGEVARAIDDCTHYLLVVSPASKASQWCSFEYGYASAAKKTICLFLADETVEPPSYMTQLATADLEVVGAYFEDAIDADAVERLVAEILDDTVMLEDFRPTSERDVFERPDREQVESEEPRSPWVDWSSEPSERLVEVRLGDPLRLTYVRDGHARAYELVHRPELDAVVVEPSKARSEVVGRVETGPDGVRTFLEPHRDVEKRLRQVSVSGWYCSGAFWRSVQARIAGRLAHDST